MTLGLPEFGTAFGGSFRRIVQTPGGIAIFYDVGQGQGWNDMVEKTGEYLRMGVDRVWLLELKRGKEQRMDTGKAGVFDVVEVVLEPRPYPGETIGKDKLEKFEGVFGIQGSIHLWVEKRTGVVVRIQGDLPLSVLTLGIDVVLDSYSGTPAGFAPVSPASPR